MKTKIIIPSVLFVMLSVMTSCNPSEKKPEDAASDAVKTETVLLQKEKISTELRMPAELVGFQQVDLYAKVSSFVKDLKADIGTQVTKGQLLIVLEAPEISSQQAAAESRLRAMEATYMASKSTYNRLFETSKVAGTISQNDLEQASARKNADYAQYQAAIATHKEIGIMKSYLEIRAPFNGIVTSRNVNLGAYVGPSGKGSELPLLTVQQQTKLRLSVSIPELYTGYLKQGDEISFTVKSSPETFKAKIQRMSGALDLRLRSERVEMDVDNNSKKLLPGMVAEAILPLNARDSTFTVPKTAVVNSAEGIYIIAISGKKAHHVTVKKGREIEDRIEVFGELKSGDKIVKAANEEIREGDEINE